MTDQDEDPPPVLSPPAGSPAAPASPAAPSASSASSVEFDPSLRCVPGVGRREAQLVAQTDNPLSLPGDRFDLRQIKALAAHYFPQKTWEKVIDPADKCGGLSPNRAPP